MLSTADGSILAGPTTLFTEPVLSSPVKPPKRALQTIPGSGSGISGAVRFRIVTYNILAELYATKQVRIVSSSLITMIIVKNMNRLIRMWICGICLGRIEERFCLKN